MQEKAQYVLGDLEFTSSVSLISPHPRTPATHAACQCMLQHTAHACVCRMCPMHASCVRYTRKYEITELKRIEIMRTLL